MADWAKLAAEHKRYERLAAKYLKPGPRRMLALDGGGIRGVITLQVLLKLEQELKRITGAGEEFRLGDYFHYIAGTSTGAIIAACLAYGYKVEEVVRLYDDMGKEMFQKPFNPLKRVYAEYESGPLTQQLKSKFVEDDGSPARLGSGKLRCLLMCVLRNVTTDSPWPVSSNPFARYNLGDETDDPQKRRAYEDCNLYVPLYQLVRGSTAAPTFFEPEVIRVGRRKAGDPPRYEDEVFKFEDGGVTPYNNPAFLLYRMATIPQYRVAWETGEDRLLLISVGTGAAPRLDNSFGANFILTNAKLIPNALMYGALVDQDINCRMSGRCVHGAPIDSELQDMMVPAAGGGGPEGPKFTPPPGRERAFTYARYNAELSERWFAQNGFAGLDPAVVGALDSTDHIDELRAIGRKVAEGVRLEEAGPDGRPKFDPRLWEV